MIPLHSEMKKTQQLPITAPSSSVDESSLVKPDRLPFEIDDLSVTTRSSWDSFLVRLLLFNFMTFPFQYTIHSTDDNAKNA